MSEENGKEKREVTVKEDLADRYQQMLDTQLTGILNFDTKAWRIARLVSLLLGVFVTGVTAFSPDIGLQLSTAVLPAAVSIAGGIIALVISLIFAALCILSTTTGFGLNVELADELNEGELDVEDYPGIITKGYAKNITNNIKVMEAKGRRLRYSSASLIFGITAVSAGGLLLFLSIGFWLQIGTLVVVGVIIVYVLYYILTMQYSVLEDDEDEDDDDSDEALDS